MAALPRDFRHARHARKIAALEQRRGGAQIQVELHGQRLAAGEPHGLAGLARTRDPVEHLHPAGGGGLSIGLLEEMEGGPESFAASELEILSPETHAQLRCMRAAALPGEFLERRLRPRCVGERLAVVYSINRKAWVVGPIK